MEPVNLALLAVVVILLVACAQEREFGGTASRASGEAPPGTEAYDRADEREAMVAQQIVARRIVDPRVIAAMAAVPRHEFVPPEESDFAYVDGPRPIGSNQTISQPYIVALMTEAVELAYGERVLEIGTGSGYQAAILAELTPHVFTIEIVEELAERAGSTLRQLGYDSVVGRAGDGYAGWPEHAPFDAIVVTAAPDHVPPALVDQLAVGGRLCIPVGEQDEIQELMLLIRREDGSVDQRIITPVRFVPMTGEAQDREQTATEDVWR